MKVVRPTPDESDIVDSKRRADIASIGRPWLIIDTESGVEFVLIVSCDNKTPPFYCARFEITNAQFRKWKPEHDSGSREQVDFNYPSYPVVNVTWAEASAYCATLSYRLPTGPQWDCIAAQTVSDCNSENDYDEAAEGSITLGLGHFPHDDGWRFLAPVGSMPSSGCGLFDIGGNVSEWCDGWYRGTGERGQRFEEGTFRLIRGGAWSYFGSCDRVCGRSHGADPDTRNQWIGFRPVFVPTVD
jgi:sulfatase modifying factor 1